MKENKVLNFHNHLQSLQNTALVQQINNNALYGTNSTIAIRFSSVLGIVEPFLVANLEALNNESTNKIPNIK